MGPLSETDVIQTESPENFVAIFEILPIDKEWKSNEITSCRCWASCGFRNATHQVDFFPTSTTLELELFNGV